MRMLTGACGTFEHDMWMKKKPGPREPGLRYWPREADTITFQEGLLNFRATGGGGHMRDANAQRAGTMTPIDAMQQDSTSHVRHAEIQGPHGQRGKPITEPHKGRLIRMANAAPC